MSKHISEISVEEITKIGQEATLEARKKALESGQEVISKDESGQLVSEKMNPDGTITRTLVEESEDK